MTPIQAQPRFGGKYIINTTSPLEARRIKNKIDQMAMLQPGFVHKAMNDHNCSDVVVRTSYDAASDTELDTVLAARAALEDITKKVQLSTGAEVERNHDEALSLRNEANAVYTDFRQAMPESLKKDYQSQKVDLDAVKFDENTFDDTDKFDKLESDIARLHDICSAHAVTMIQASQDNSYLSSESQLNTKLSYDSFSDLVHTMPTSSFNLETGLFTTGSAASGATESGPTLGSQAAQALEHGKKAVKLTVGIATQAISGLLGGIGGIFGKK